MRLPINIALNFEAEWRNVANKRDAWDVASALVVSNVMRQVSRGRIDHSYFLSFIYSKPNSQVFETHSIRSSFSHLILPICYSSLLVTRTMCKWNSDAQDSILFRLRKNNTFSGTLSHSASYKILRANRISRSAYENVQHMFSVYFVCAARGVCSHAVAQ